MADWAEPALQRGRDGVPSETCAAVAALLLVERRVSRTSREDWTARAPDGSPLEVWRVIGPEGQPERLQRADALSRLAEVRHPSLVPVLSVGEREEAVWVVSELDRGRPLRRLLAIATLTPVQAARVAVGILDGLRALHEVGLWHGGLDEDTVHVGETGEIRLGGWGLGVDRHDVEAGRAGDDEMAVRLLGRLTGHVGRPGHHRPVQAAALLRALADCEAGRGEPAALLAAARETATALLAGATAERAARELAALIAMLERDRAAAPAAAAPRRPAPATPARPPHALLSHDAVWRPAPNWGRWLAAGLGAAILVALVGAVVVARPHLQVRPLTTASRPTPSPVTRATPTPAPPTAPPTAAGARPVPVLAPPTAGPITAVEIQPLQGACEPGAQCAVQVTVRLQPQPAATDVRWSLRTIDRCTGASSTLPGASVTALAGWAYVYGTSWPTLPAGHPLAVVAVTDTPAAAASPPVLAGGSGTC